MLQTTIPVVQKLKDSEFTFYLTGSHFFDYACKESDIDFFAEYSGKIKLFLKSIDFYPVISNYGDNSVTEVWLHKVENIHIQLVRNAQHKYAVQCVIPSKLLRALPKNLRTLFWDFALKNVNY